MLLTSFKMVYFYNIASGLSFNNCSLQKISKNPINKYILLIRWTNTITLLFEEKTYRVIIAISISFLNSVHFSLPRESNTCKYLLLVPVLHCNPPQRIANGYYHFYPSNDFRYGGTATYGCYPGYERNGNRVLECLVSETWSAVAPSCESESHIVIINIFFNLMYLSLLINAYYFVDIWFP